MVWGGTKPYDSEEAGSSINHSISSAQPAITQRQERSESSDGLAARPAGGGGGGGGRGGNEATRMVDDGPR